MTTFKILRRSPFGRNLTVRQELTADTPADALRIANYQTEMRASKWLGYPVIEVRPLTNSPRDW